MALTHIHPITDISHILLIVTGIAVFPRVFYESLCIYIYVCVCLCVFKEGEAL